MGAAAGLEPAATKPKVEPRGTRPSERDSNSGKPAPQVVALALDLSELY
jgi:hypothetical protein